MKNVKNTLYSFDDTKDYGFNYSNFYEFKSDTVLFVKTLLYTSDFIKIIEFIDAKIPKFFDEYSYLKLFLYKIQFFRLVIVSSPEIEINRFFNKFIYPMIINKTNFQQIQSRLFMIKDNPSLVKGREYQKLWEECCKTFEIGVELGISEFFNKVDNYLNKENLTLFQNTRQRLESIEQEICKDYEARELCKGDRNEENPFDSPNNLIFDFKSDHESHSFIQNDFRDILLDEDNLETFSDTSLTSFSKNINSNYTSIGGSTRQSSRIRQDVSIIKHKLKEFQFKYLKRENVDKKIMRKFRKFLKDKYKKNNQEITNAISHCEFWKDFITLNLLPPLNYAKEEREFKSFNINYMKWIFEHNFSSELYDVFIKNNYFKLLNLFVVKFKLNQKDEEYSMLKRYVLTLAIIFGPFSQVEANVNVPSSDYLFEVIPTAKKEESEKEK